MTLTTRRILLWLLAFLGFFVGAWAAFFPVSFYTSFPGPFDSWISMDGPYNEHLLRDVGTLNLGLAAASLVAARYRVPGPSVAVGVAWIVYSIPHLAYHSAQLAHLDAVNIVGQLVSLSATLVLALPLLVPDRAGGATPRD